MSDLTPYQQRRAERAAAKGQPEQPSPSRPTYPPEVRAARTAERNRRNTEVRRRATTILIERYPEEYAELARIEAEGLDTERGPLPGDPDYVEGAYEWSNTRGPRRVSR